MSQNAWKDEVLGRYGLTETDRLIYDAFNKITNILEAPKLVVSHSLIGQTFNFYLHRQIPAAAGSLEYRWRCVRNMIAKRSVQDYFWRYCTLNWVPAGSVGTVERQQSLTNLLQVIAPDALTAALVRVFHLRGYYCYALANVTLTLSTIFIRLIRINMVKDLVKALLAHHLACMLRALRNQALEFSIWIFFKVHITMEDLEPKRHS